MKNKTILRYFALGILMTHLAGCNSLETLDADTAAVEASNAAPNVALFVTDAVKAAASTTEGGEADASAPAYSTIYQVALSNAQGDEVVVFDAPQGMTISLDSIAEKLEMLGESEVPVGTYNAVVVYVAAASGTVDKDSAVRVVLPISLELEAGEQDNIVIDLDDDENGDMSETDHDLEIIDDDMLELPDEFFVQIPATLKAVNDDGSLLVSPMFAESAVDVTVMLTDDTELVGNSDEDLSLEDLTIGQALEVIGAYNATADTVTAEIILTDMGNDEEFGEMHELYGEVAAFDGSVLVLEAEEGDFAFDSDELLIANISNAEFVLTSLDEIEVEQELIIQGFWDGQSFLAELVIDVSAMDDFEEDEGEECRDHDEESESDEAEGEESEGSDEHDCEENERHDDDWDDEEWSEDCERLIDIDPENASDEEVIELMECLFGDEGDELDFDEGFGDFIEHLDELATDFPECADMLPEGEIEVNEEEIEEFVECVEDEYEGEHDGDHEGEYDLGDDVEEIEEVLEEHGEEIHECVEIIEHVETIGVIVADEFFECVDEWFDEHEGGEAGDDESEGDEEDEEDEIDDDELEQEEEDDELEDDE